MTLTPEEINIVLCALRESAHTHHAMSLAMVPGSLDRAQHEQYRAACAEISNRIEAAAETPSRPSLIIPPNLRK